MDKKENSLPNVFGPFLKKARSAICPIFGRSEKGSELLGSGVLLKISEAAFLLTASHVLDHKEDYDLLVPRKDRMGSLYGDMSRTRLPTSGNRLDDKYDIGFIRLEPKLAEDLDADLKYLEHDDVDLFDTTSASDMYTSVGFPIKKCLATREAMTTEQFSISGDGTNGEIYLKHGRSIQDHLAIRFRNKKAISYNTWRRSMAPAPHGMSGGGIFAWSKQLPDPSALAPPKLVGILNEYHRSDNMFFGTRLNCYLSGIARKHPELPLSPTLPFSHRGPVVTQPEKPRKSIRPSFLSQELPQL